MACSNSYPVPTTNIIGHFAQDLVHSLRDAFHTREVSLKTFSPQIAASLRGVRSATTLASLDAVEAQTTVLLDRYVAVLAEMRQLVNELPSVEAATAIARASMADPSAVSEAQVTAGVERILNYFVNWAEWWERRHDVAALWVTLESVCRQVREAIENGV